MESGSIHITLRSGHYIRFRLAGVGYYETSGGNRQLFPNLQAGQMNVSDNRVEYSNMLPGIKIHLSYLSDRLKEELIVTQQARSLMPHPSQYGVDPDSTFLAFVMELDPDSSLRAFMRDSIAVSSLQAGIYSINFQGFQGIKFKNIRKKLAFFLPLDYAYLKIAGSDSLNAAVPMKKLKRRIITRNGKIYLVSGVPYNWITSIPAGDVVIDPTINITEEPTDDTWLENENVQGFRDCLIAGKDGDGPKKRALLKFDLSAIPSCAQIEASGLNMFYYNRSGDEGPARPLRVYRLIRHWNQAGATVENATSTTNWTEPYAEGDYDENYTDEVTISSEYGWQEWDVTGMVDLWHRGLQSNHGMILIATNEDEAGYDVRFYSSESVMETLPYLDITYRKILQTYYYLKDHLGSIRVTIDDESNMVGYDDYYPYGEQIPGRSGNSGNPDDVNKFTGKELDQGTGLYYFGARYYDPAIGRWLSVDPMVEKYPSISPYVYTLNNPVRSIDPDGKDVIDAISRQSLTVQEMERRTYNAISDMLVANYETEKGYFNLDFNVKTTLENQRDDLYQPQAGNEIWWGGNLQTKELPFYGSTHEGMPAFRVNTWAQLSRDEAGAGMSTFATVGVCRDRANKDLLTASFNVNKVDKAGNIKNSITFIKVTGSLKELNTIFSRIGYEVYRTDSGSYDFRRISDEEDDKNE